MRTRNFPGAKDRRRRRVLERLVEDLPSVAPQTEITEALRASLLRDPRSIRTKKRRDDHRVKR